TITHFILYCLWIVPYVVQALILIALVRRGLLRQLPIFTSYTVFSIFKFIALLTVAQLTPRTPSGNAVYFAWYSLTLAVEIALRFGVICELFTHVFQKEAALHHLQKPVFRWTTVVFLALAFCLAIYTHRGDADPGWFATHVLERSATMVQVGLVLCLFLVATYLNISWRKPVFGIALGLGIFWGVDMAVAAIRSQVGYSWDHALEVTIMGTHLCVVLLWLFYLLAPELRPEPMSNQFSEHELETWNQELENLFQTLKTP
ncbi:MAG: hypothetical protein ACRD2S_07330, partial [Terriglobales bacterium]